MNEKIKEMMEKLSGDQTFIDKVTELNEKYPDIELNKSEFIKLVREYGYEITEEDIDSISYVDESELEQVAGRKMKDNGVSDCLCVIAGGGVKDEWQKTCGCFVGGGGGLTDAGKKRFPQLKWAIRCPFFGG